MPPRTHFLSLSVVANKVWALPHSDHIFGGGGGGGGE